MSQVVRIQDVKNDGLLVNPIIDMLKSYQVFCFLGDLGAGKTTYIKSICRELGVKDEMSSPSFSIVNEYKTAHGETLYHFDLYRLKNEAELIDIGWYDYLNEESSLFIEWPDKAENVMPEDAVYVQIEIEADSTRKITIQKPEP
jgi:tRNA threonylcarbamoyladenosine biosynthesis protein TsaE